MKKITKDMTMSDKGPGSFYRRVIKPDECAVDDEFRETYLNQGAFAISSRSDRSTLSFGKSSDHPKWDIRSRAGDPEAQAKRETFGSDLSSSMIGSMTKSTTRGRRFNVSENEDRLRLIESGKLGNDYDKTARIHEARRMFRRQQRRELHGKQLTMAGKYCKEALIEGEAYRDDDHHVLCKPSGDRESRVGIGMSMTRHGSSPRAELSRSSQTSGELGMFHKESVKHRVHHQPSGRRGRYLGSACEHRVIEPGGGKLRMTHPHLPSDVAHQASGQIGQFWLKQDNKWIKTHPHDHEDDNPEAIPHWHHYPELNPHRPDHNTQQLNAMQHREMLSSGSIGSYVSPRGPRSSQAPDFNEPLGCALHPSKDSGAKFKPPLGPCSDGLPIALKPTYEKATPEQIEDWQKTAMEVQSHNKYSGFHKSAKASFLAAAEDHKGADVRGGVSMTRTAREKCRRATVDRSTASVADLGWSHCLRGQKW